jgi:UDP-N-acetylglucosamine--N-acetylmuramyl-(pentapeptide) pyrophosphoryl-undecaprenol N-acetylglucosamine transferase
VFASTGNQLEQRVLDKMHFTLERVTVEGIKGRGLWNQTKSICKLPKGIYQAIRILSRFKPDLVVGLGSYSAGPVVLAARILGVKIVLHEQNILPGITNRVLARFADMIFVSFEDTKARLPSGRSKFTGNPVRQAILNGSRQLKGEDGAESGQNRFNILIIGGSQGAHRINITVVEALKHLSRIDDLYIFHQTGSADEKMVQDAYAGHEVASTVQSFFDDMGPLFRSADLIVCRAGATTVAEITAIGKAVIYIPFPNAADDHQTLNAASLTSKGAAEMILEKDLTAEMLGEKIEYYASNPDALGEMARRAGESGNPKAARDIVAQCYALVNSSNR